MSRWSRWQRKIRTTYNEIEGLIHRDVTENII